MQEPRSKYRSMDATKEGKQKKKNGIEQGKQAWYHIKGKGKHVIKHVKRLT